MNNREQPSNMSSSIYNELRIERTLCDAILKVGDVEFPVHKIILCNCSLYFWVDFTHLNPPDQKVFNIRGLSPDMMELIIDFAYTGSVSVTEDNVRELLLAANRFNVMDLVKICCDFLGEQLCPVNCVGIWQLTTISFLPKLRAKAYQYILNHFEQVVAEEEFLNLTVEELTDILDTDHLDVQEDTVYEAVIKWIAHAPAEREQHISTLLPKVRLRLMTVKYLRQYVLSNELVSSNSECRSMVDEATGAIPIRSSRPGESGFYHPLARPRLPYSILLAIGGSSNDRTHVIEAYDYRADSWLSVRNDRQYHRAFHGAAFLNGYVYQIGGCCNEFSKEYYCMVRRFDLTTRTWDELGAMHEVRYYVSVTVLNGCIYAMGGHDGKRHLNTAERYQPETNQWTLIAPMHEQRREASCTTLNNRIYICGGWNRHGPLATAEFYNAETNQWTMIQSMNSPRSGLGVIAYAGQVFAVGGSDGTNDLRIAEVYNTDTDMWNDVKPMSTPRSNFGIEVINNRIFVAGGCNLLNTSCVEYYDVLTGVWSAACPLRIPRRGLSCCVVSGLPNLADYTVPRNVLADEQDESAAQC
ncbi:kelch-like protein 10 [Archocentrus centrarchus]|uniref:kelch-like protein 10 n=1 Tax=Archocentrus centrarchus TaxID=63155 RepID=UPI0011EA0279|nr:kelch-like protein 10 [Archocentrus centrarchus]